MQQQNSAACRQLASEIPQPFRMPKSARRRIEDAIDTLIGLLDLVDGDADHEDGGDREPSLGWTKTGAWGDVAGRDLEVIHV